MVVCHLKHVNFYHLLRLHFMCKTWLDNSFLKSCLVFVLILANHLRCFLLKTIWFVLIFNSIDLCKLFNFFCLKFELTNLFFRSFLKNYLIVWNCMERKILKNTKTTIESPTSTPTWQYFYDSSFYLTEKSKIKKMQPLGERTCWSSWQCSSE